MNRLANFEERDRRAERNFRLMQILPKEYERYKQLFHMIMDEVETEKKLEVEAAD